MASLEKRSGFVRADFQKRVQGAETDNAGDQRDGAEDDEDDSQAAGHGPGEVEG